MTLVQLDIGLTSLINTFQRTYGVVLTRGYDETTSDGSNLTATEEGITHMTAVHLHIGEIDVTVVDITATEDTATIIEGVEFAFFVRLVVDLLLIIIYLWAIFRA